MSCHDINYNWFHNTFYAYNQCNNINFFKNFEINIIIILLLSSLPVRHRRVSQEGVSL